MADRTYPIRIGEGAFELAIAELKKISKLGRKVFCIADKSVVLAHESKIQILKDYAEIIEIEGGEKSKSLSMVGELCSILAQKNADRKSCLLALGGGVIGDLTGFVASAYMRGIDFYQMPTTLLAMVDSSVGGKTGVNIPEGKNLVGAFYQPCAVFADTSFLKTLPAREFAAGMAEVIKCGVLGDKKLFELLEKNKLTPRHSNLAEAIKRSCALKAKIVAADERETARDGGRALLNFGHTFGHAIEKCAGFGSYLHGEAVALGMLMAAILAEKLSKKSGTGELARIKKLVKKYALPTKLSGEFNAIDMLESMKRDKKASSGNLKFVIADVIGKSRTAIVDSEKVLQVLNEFLK